MRPVAGSATSLFGGRLGRHTAVYGSGSIVGLALGLVSVAVLTRVLDVQSFGQLAVLLLFSSLLTVLFNLGTLPGTFRMVFGASGDDVADDEQCDAESEDKRRALTTGLLLTALIALVGTSAVIALSEPIAGILALEGQETRFVEWAAASGGIGAVWRFASQTLRFERRPLAYVVVSASRPLLVLAAVVPLVLSGRGVEGVLVGTTGGTAAAFLLTLGATRASYRMGVSTRDARAILNGGRALVVVVVSFWIVQNADLYVVYVLASPEQVAAYRVASRIATIVSYALSAFFMAWMPLRRTAIFAAVEREQTKSSIGAELVTYVLFVGLWMLVGLAASADLLIRIAPPAYAFAAPLIPALGAGVVAHGVFIALYRGSRFPRRQGWYVGVSTLALAVFLCAAPPLVREFGAYGAPAAQVLAFSAAGVVILLRSQRGPSPLAFDYERMGKLLFLAGAGVTGALAARELPAEWASWVKLLAFAGFPCCALVSGGIPRRHFPRIGSMARAIGRRQPRRRTHIRDRLAELASCELQSLDALVHEHSPTLVTEQSGQARLTLLESFVRSLRHVGGLGAPKGRDGAIGAYLLSQASRAERDARARRLWREGVDPLELHELEVTLGHLRQLPNRAWATAKSQVYGSAIRG
jgi:O-antigen/teichoic acid export membrane protein